MVNPHIHKIFLSAGIPSAGKGNPFYDTADEAAIKASVQTLAAEVAPNAHLVWGGHPAINPLIHEVLDKMNPNIRKHLTMYQSTFFKDVSPVSSIHSEKRKLVRGTVDRDISLLKMRLEILTEHEFAAGVFIGGMEGVADEYDLFIKTQPKALTLVLPTTGGAAKRIFDYMKPPPDETLAHNYAYTSLFRKALFNYL